MAYLHTPSSLPRQVVVPTGTVLVIDDDPSLHTLVRTWLSKGEFPILEAESGSEGLELARANADQIDCIILDVTMPGMDGFSVLKALRESPATARIPVVLLTAYANADDDIVRGAETGAVEHLAKPFSGAVLNAKIKVIADNARAERLLRARLRAAEEHAAIDPLTRLFNRRHLTQRLAELSAHVRRHKRSASVLMIDLDHFKLINDTYGHAEGDRVLVHVSQAIRDMLREDDLGFRYGGEEFLIILQVCDANQALRVGERLAAALKAAPILLGSESRVITFSGGVAAADAESQFSVEKIVERADAALYEAKREGRDRVYLAKIAATG